MKRHCFALIFLFLLPFILKAQISLLPSVGVQIPTGGFSSDNYLGTDFGGTLALKYEITESFDMGLSVGYHRFSYSLEKQMNAMIPITATFENRFGDYAFKPMIGFDAGIYNFYHTEKTTNDTYSLNTTRTDTKMGIAPSVGFYINLSDAYSLCAIAKYHYACDDSNPYTYVGLNVGLNIRFLPSNLGYTRF